MLKGYFLWFSFAMPNAASLSRQNWIISDTIKVWSATMIFLAPIPSPCLNYSTSPFPVKYNTKSLLPVTRIQYSPVCALNHGKDWRPSLQSSPISTAINPKENKHYKRLEQDKLLENKHYKLLHEPSHAASCCRTVRFLLKQQRLTIVVLIFFLFFFFLFLTAVLINYKNVKLKKW